MTYNTETATDAERIAQVCRTILAAHPDAVSFDVSSSDQGSGWVLYAVALRDGSRIDNDERYVRIEDAVSHDLAWIRWGAWGDRNKDAYLTVSLPDGQWIKDEEQDL